MAGRTGLGKRIKRGGKMEQLRGYRTQLQHDPSQEVTRSWPRMTPSRSVEDFRDTIGVEAMKFDKPTHRSKGKGLLFWKFKQKWLKNGGIVYWLEVSWSHVLFWEGWMWEEAWVCFTNTEFKVPEKHWDKNVNHVAGNTSLQNTRKGMVWV